MLRPVGSIRKHSLGISMNGANFYSLYLYIDVLKSPIQRCPTSLVEVVQYHLGHYLDTGYAETYCPTSGNESGD